MKYLSVCAGIEAATCAWHHMGWEPVAFSEIEKFPSAVLAHHYPNVPNWGDMTKFKEWPDANIDVLVGGTPCQSFSVAGLRKGLDDPRGNLMLTFGAIAKRYRPQWLVWENVPGVLSSNGGRDFGTFLGMLGELGYGFAYRVLDAQYFGVAQRRRRCFVVGHLGDWHRAAAVLFERHSLSGHPAPSRQARKGTTGGVAAGIGKRYDPETDTMIPVAQPRWWDGGDVAATLTKQNANGAQRMPDKDNFGAVLQPMAFKVRGGCEGGGKGYLGSEDAAFTVATTQDQWLAQPIPYDLYQITAPVNRQNRKPGDPCHTLARDNAAHAAVAIQGTLGNRGLRSHTELDGHGAYIPVAIQGTLIGHGENAGPQGSGADVSGAMFTLTKTDVHAVAIGLDEEQNARVDGFGTLKARMEGGGFEGTVMTPAMQVRRLTPVECERLQGFPDGYTNIPWRGKPESPDGPRYKALGNSMAVPVMRYIGERINKVEAL